MRALAAILTLAVWSCRIHVHAHDPLPRALLAALGISETSPVHNILTCTKTLGPTKCLSALSAWRAKNAIYAFEKGEAASNLVADVKQFPWTQYSNSSDEDLYAQLCDGAENLLRYRSLSLTMIPGYTFELESKGNGTLNVDVLKNDEPTGRSSMKKLQKQFYNIIPLLLLPGLIMSAILPFVLPALKMSVIAVGMLNNMALSGAVFTLLRNNAFNDHYEHKVIYVNEGYKNEKHSDVFYKEVPLEHLDVHDESPSDIHAIVGQKDDEGYLVQDYPTNDQWITQYYGDGGVKTRRSSQRKRYTRL